MSRLLVTSLLLTSLFCYETNAQKLKEPVKKSGFYALYDGANTIFRQTNFTLTEIIDKAVSEGRMSIYQGEKELNKQESYRLFRPIINELVDSDNDPFTPEVIHEVEVWEFLSGFQIMRIDYFEDAKKPKKKQLEWVSFYSDEYVEDGDTELLNIRPNEYRFSCKYDDLTKILSETDFLWYNTVDGVFWKNGFVTSNYNSNMIAELERWGQKELNNQYLTTIDHIESKGTLEAKSISFYQTDNFFERDEKAFKSIDLSSITDYYRNPAIIPVEEALHPYYLQYAEGKSALRETDWPVPTEYSLRKISKKKKVLKGIKQTINTSIFMTEEEKLKVYPYFEEFLSNVKAQKLSFCKSDSLLRKLSPEEIKDRFSITWIEEVSSVENDPFSPYVTKEFTEWLETYQLLSFHALYELTADTDGNKKQKSLKGIGVYLRPDIETYLNDIYKPIAFMNLEDIEKLKNTVPELWTLLYNKIDNHTSWTIFTASPIKPIY